MISPEVLRRFPFFAGLNAQQLNSIAMIAEKSEIQKGEILFEECQTANNLYFLVDGQVELSYKSQKDAAAKTSKQLFVGDINPGEVFGISSLIEPYNLNATAHAAQLCTVIKIDAVALRILIEKDEHLGYRIMAQIAKAVLERLASTRVQLAAAWA